MNSRVVKAPGVIKFLGEHAVVYGRTALAVAIDMYATAEMTKGNNGHFTISLPRLKIEQGFTEIGIEMLYRLYKNNKSLDSFMEIMKMNHQKFNFANQILPFAIIAGRLLSEEKIGLSGKKIEINSEIPIRMGIASSASCYTAFMVALLENLDNLGQEKLTDIARDGERISHRNKSAGRIDVPTSFYGKYVRYDKETGPKRIETEIDMGLELILVDTGPKISTAETVGHVNELYYAQQNYMNFIFDQVNECSLNGIEALEHGNYKILGENMYRTHELLASIGLSTQNLDKAVQIAKDSNAYGAKLSGGGGGGILIAISKEPQKLMELMRSAGFESRLVRVSQNGARNYLNQRDKIKSC